MLGPMSKTWYLYMLECAGGRLYTGIALDVEALGVDTLWVPDHLQRTVPGLPPIGTPVKQKVDPLATTGGAAAAAAATAAAAARGR